MIKGKVNIKLYYASEKLFEDIKSIEKQYKVDSLVTFTYHKAVSCYSEFFILLNSELYGMICGDYQLQYYEDMIKKALELRYSYPN